MTFTIPENATTEEKLLQLTDALEYVKSVIGDIIVDEENEDSTDFLDEAMEAIDDAIDAISDAVDELEEEELELDEEAEDDEDF